MKMKPTVYLETTVVSYLAANPSRDLIVAGHQQITHEWWVQQRSKFELKISPYVVLEIQRGDSQTAFKRMGFVAGIAVLDVSEAVIELAEAYNAILRLPKAKEYDLFHLAIASWHSVEYLLTWNCKHIASAQVKRALAKVNEAAGLAVPILCTPEELEE